MVGLAESKNANNFVKRQKHLRFITLRACFDAWKLDKLVKTTCWV